jgi:tetratricopeptide (TPR) repeat protein
MNLDKLKELGRRHELRDEWRKAIDAYQRVLAELAEAGEPGDPSLHNRIGDLALKAGDMGAALRAYGAAADTYADQGFFNNAIAVCGKILRVAPTRTATYLRLADLHARKNVVAEARRNLTEYVERMIASGHVAEAVEPLREFATRFSASAELRATLADLLREIEPRVQEERLAELAREMDAGPGVGADGEPTGGGTSSREPSPARGTATGIVFLDTAVEPVGVRMVQPTAIGEDATPEPVPVPGFEPTHAAGPEPSAVVVEPLVQTEVPAPVELPGLETRVEFTAPASADLTLEPLSLEPVPLDLAEEPPMAAAPAPPQPPEPMFEGLDVPEPELERETEGPPEPAAELDRLMEAGRWSEALAVVNTLLARSPDNLTRHRQRVELAYRVDDREELVGAYLGLARALERAGAGETAAGARGRRGS